MSDNDEQVLSWEQTSKLDSILSDVKIIHGRRNFPSIEICTKDFIRNLSQLLIKNNVTINYIRINGGAASYIIADGDTYQYTDIDIIFGCTLIDNTNNDYFDIIKETVFQYLISLLPTHLRKDKISTCNIKEAYITKFIKVYDKTDIWSLISLNNEFGQNIELKFVDKMKRQFQFSVDSFQINLDSLLQYYDFQDSQHSQREETQEMNRNFYPSVNAISVYGNFKEAKYHLDNKLITTKTPEEMRGGGLLKYCNLLVRGFQPLNYESIQERYMCSRFFIDFKDINSQQLTLGTYLHTHFFNNPMLQCNYLIKLHEIVKRSTVCLMNHERQMTLTLIQSFIEFFKNIIHNQFNLYQRHHYQYVQQVQNQKFYQQQLHNQHQDFVDNSSTISNDSDLKRPNTLDILSRSSASPSLILSSTSSSICCSPVNTTNIPINNNNNNQHNKEDNFFRGYIPQNANLGIEIMDGYCPPYLHVNNFTNDDKNT
jgi:terminal nucleotidyltransferase 5A/B